MYKHRIFLILFILLCTSPLTAPVFAMENEPDEFLGIPWGAVSPAKNFIGGNMGGFQEMGKMDDSTTVYQRPLGKVSIAGVEPLSPIDYFFHDSQGFVRAHMRFKGVENYQRMLKACVDQWGKPDTERRDTNRESDYDLVTHIWHGEKITVFLTYYYKKSQVGNLSLCLNNYLEGMRKKEDAEQ